MDGSGKICLEMLGVGRRKTGTGQIKKKENDTGQEEITGSIQKKGKTYYAALLISTQGGLNEQKI